MYVRFDWFEDWGDYKKEFISENPLEFKFYLNNDAISS